ncbi:LysR family transcriptional regulator [Acinetobacter rathckeae]|uniref:LysR family transcriptional regulator n=1 Tax=Acinetobacter rathckeae TaxID=2605272 RepID=UPI0018A306A9|nr:LysR family transcriptional regulator [Acinetobacter rathckeae]MBF7687117.1 LysR family transcriptional regulator [Acinetobacter rathckeae]MBF7694531.1 LysR family transcriptional regulator [Acinetobacter rathckeae]
MNIDISDIKSFITVAELKSITAAAHKLNYLQSNMTAKIKKIENHYKKQLFIRKPKGVDLTESGVDLYKQYKKMMFTWEETENKIYQQEHSLRFGTNTSLGSMRFYQPFQQLYTAYSDLSVSIKTGSTSYIEDEILAGHLDIGYVLGYPSQKNLQYIHKANDQLVVIGKNLMNHQRLEDGLHQQNILLASEACCYATTLNHIYTDHQISKGELTHIYDHEALIQFTQLGMGVSMIAKSLVKKFNIQYYRETPEKYRDIGLYLIARAEHQFTPIERQFIGLSDALEKI